MKFIVQIQNKNPTALGIYFIKSMLGGKKDVVFIVANNLATS